MSLENVTLVIDRIFEQFKVSVHLIWWRYSCIKRDPPNILEREDRDKNQILVTFFIYQHDIHYLPKDCYIPTEFSIQFSCL